MSDSKYFQTSKKGEVFELRNELHSDKKEKRVEAVKKVIAMMTVGKDVQSLFPDVVNQMQTENVEMKKLVYLYIHNYAASQPDVAIMAVNSFIKDASHVNPLLRALAIRTMGYCRVDRITEYLITPLSKALDDSDPYVRKTAALTVVKLYDIQSQCVEDQGFIAKLRSMISDSNPMVVSNAVAALHELSMSAGKDFLKANKSTFTKILNTLNDCTEWGKVFLLDTLAKYNPKSERVAQDICERITPQLQHVNPAVVMSAVKVIIHLFDRLDSEHQTQLAKKLSPPLVTLLNTEPEIQYVALRNINLIVQKYEKILNNEIKVFFCKYNDAIYVKKEKLEVMIKLANDKNIDQVLLELKDYASEVDVEFVRKSVRAIGRCAIKLDNAAERCVKTLLELVKTKVSYVVQEAIIVIKDIFRRYPNKYEKVIVDLCRNLDTLDEPEAKESMIWILGEYAERLDNATDRLEYFVDSFADEPARVQLQLLTATVKLFLKMPEQNKDLVQKVLNLATEESKNPDLRDRGYVYWRLLSTDPAVARAVVLAERPTISDTTFDFSKEYLDQLLDHVSTLASIYHKPPESFVLFGKEIDFYDTGGVDEDTSSSDDSSSDDDSSSSSSEESKKEKKKKKPVEKPVSKPVNTDIGDLLDFGTAAKTTSAGGDLLDLFGSPQPSVPVGRPKKELLSSEKGNGIKVAACYYREGDKAMMELAITNVSNPVTLRRAALKFNENFLKLSPGPIKIPEPITAGNTCIIPIILNQNGQYNNAKVQIQMAMKTDAGVVYFQDKIPIEVMFGTDGKLSRENYLKMWQDGSFTDHQKVKGKLSTMDFQEIISRLEKNRIFFVAKRTAPNTISLFYSCKIASLWVMVELTVAKTGAAKCVVKARDEKIAEATSSRILELI